MLQVTKKTHTEVKLPRMSLSRLADYMSASEQARRGIVQSCKYRAIARVVQHNEAKAIISNHLLSGVKGPGDLQGKADFLRNKLTDDDFEADLNDHNADYVEQFIKALKELDLPNAERLPATTFEPQLLNGVRITFQPQLRLQRTTKTNKIKSGALMLRYAKNKTVDPKTAAFQSAGIFGFLRNLDEVEKKEAERALCLTVDVVGAKVVEAPGNSIYLFNEMKAACATISERWAAIKPPKKAIL